MGAFIWPEKSNQIDSNGRQNSLAPCLSVSSFSYRELISKLEINF